MQRLADQLIGEVRAVVIARVDVIDAARDCCAEYSDSCVVIFWRAEHAASCELHCAVTHSVYDAVAEGECTPIVCPFYGLDMSVLRT